jgi:hypothetical protein
MDKSKAGGEGTVRLERRGAIGWVTIANPPVNALSQAVRAGLAVCVKAAIADPDVSLVAIRGDGRNFVAGGDISEFDAPLQPPDMNDVLAAIEGSEKPVVACMHGNALGGGLELARGDPGPDPRSRRNAASAARGGCGGGIAHDSRRCADCCREGPRYRPDRRGRGRWT